MKPCHAAIAALLLVAAPAAQAHQIWIEPSESGAAVIRFGEFGHNLREASPGLLDRFVHPTATLISGDGETTAEPAKSATGFTLPFKPGPGEAVIAEDPAFPLRTFKRGEKDVTSWFWPAARYTTGFGAQKPRLALDVVPTGEPGTFKVFFKGDPLPKVKVSIVVQSGWSQETRADEHGAVRFDLPWQGSYIVEAGHIDATPGEREGAGGSETYDGISYVTTLHVVQPDGLAPVPAVPAAAPN